AVRDHPERALLDVRVHDSLLARRIRRISVRVQRSTRFADLALSRNIGVTRGGFYAADGAQPLLHPGERTREDESFLLRRARLPGHAATDLPLPGLLARSERQDPGAHGAGWHRQRRHVLSRGAEGRRKGTRGLRRTPRLPVSLTRPLHPALQ